MSSFKFEDRPCPKCGETFSALAFWDEGERCGTCARAAYRERLAEINDGRNYTVESIGGMCPTQAEGRLADGRPYYFRARHGNWTLEFGQAGDPCDYSKWRDHAYDYVASGGDPTHGCMEDEAVLAILDRYTPTPRQPKPEPTESESA